MIERHPPLSPTRVSLLFYCDFFSFVVGMNALFGGRGGQYEDGTTDVTRTMHFGAATAEQKEVFMKPQQNLQTDRVTLPGLLPKSQQSMHVIFYIALVTNTCLYLLLEWGGTYETNPAAARSVLVPYFFNF